MRTPVIGTGAIPFELTHFVIFIIFTNCLRFSLAGERPTLYASGDNVLELDINTFDKAVYRKVAFDYL